MEKKKIHIALIGGQTYPIYLGIVDCQPDEIILVHSSATKGEAERIKMELLVNPELEEFDPVDVARIFRKTKMLADNVKADCIYSINVTGGTKPWAVAFYAYFSALPNVTLIYVDQNNRIYDLSTMKSHLSNTPLDMNLLFRLNGTKVKSLISFQDYTIEDTACLAKIEALRKHSHEIFNEISMLDEDEKITLNKQKTGSFFSKGRMERKDEGQLDWDKERNSIRIKITDNRGKIKEEVLKSPHIFTMVFSAGWFEYKVAAILSKWKHAKEIYLNIVFPYINDSSKNEIDVIVNTGNRLLFVECKTQIKDITDIDKFRTAVKNYGGMGCKALFVTDGKMKDTAAEKCRDSGILSFSLSDCVGSFSPSKMLYAMLEQDLFEINKK